jgi:DNA-binding NtrC family response regulator
VTAVPDLCLEVLAEAAAACRCLEERGAAPALLLVHDGGEADFAGARHILRAATGAGCPTPTLVLGDRTHARQALALLRLGAVEYLPEPLDLRRLCSLLDLLTLRARYLISRPGPVADQAWALGGDSEPFLYVSGTGVEAMMEQVQRVAPQETTLLLGGETGTGKTRLARVIHELSGRRDEPFLNVNCAALTPSLIESELFGHARGAFTGAERDRAGKFSEAGQGTLLLDEIDSLPLFVQAKLLRVVEERVFELVGCNRSQHLEARLIVASNRDLDGEVAAGRFREDLFYRLNVVSFHLPPLRERRMAIRPMTERFIAEFAERNGRGVWGITAEALEALMGHDWPGNIRELRNAIERAVALCPGPVIRRDDLPRDVVGDNRPTRPALCALAVEGPDAGTLVDTRERAEAQRIVQALQRNKNNRLRAAAELGISRMTLYKKLHYYGLLRRA